MAEMTSQSPASCKSTVIVTDICSTKFRAWDPVASCAEEYQEEVSDSPERTGETSSITDLTNSHEPEQWDGISDSNDSEWEKVLSDEAYYGPADETTSPYESTPEAEEPLSKIPFLIRHKFLRWLNPLLEDVLFNCARTLGLDVKARDLWEWKKSLQAGEIQLYRAYSVGYAGISSLIFEGAEHFRHEYVHRFDITARHLRHAMLLPTLLGDREREGEVARVYNLLCAASASDANEDTMDAFEEAVTFSQPSIVSTYFQLFAALQQLIETSIFTYTQTHHPAFFDHRSYTHPEQVEMSTWHLYYQRTLSTWGPTAIQDSYPDPDGHLLSSCMAKARDLRNDSEHRNGDKDATQILNHVHNSIMCLVIFGDFEGAVEVEVMGEMFVGGKTRGEVLGRLGKVYRDECLEQIWNPMERRREGRRRDAVAGILMKESVLETDLDTPNSDPSQIIVTQTWKDIKAFEDLWRNPPTNSSSQSNDSTTPQIPHSIRITEPDQWDFRRQTFSTSMHPELKILPIPLDVEMIKLHVSDDERELVANVEEPSGEADGCAVGGAVGWVIEEDNTPSSTTATSQDEWWNDGDEDEKDGEWDWNTPVDTDPDDQEPKLENTSI